MRQPVVVLEIEIPVEGQRADPRVSTACRPLTISAGDAPLGAESASSPALAAARSGPAGRRTHAARSRIPARRPCTRCWQPTTRHKRRPRRPVKRGLDNCRSRSGNRAVETVGSPAGGPATAVSGRRASKAISVCRRERWGMLSFFVDLERCTASKSCETACAAVPRATRTPAGDPGRENPRLRLPCPVQALRRRPLRGGLPQRVHGQGSGVGAGRRRRSALSGLLFICALVCPPRARSRPTPSAVARSKATSAPGGSSRGLPPACVEACPTGALRSGEDDPAGGEARGGRAGRGQDGSRSRRLPPPRGT